MANTKGRTTNKSGRSSSSKKNTRKKKNSSDDTMKFLLVLIIAGIAIALIFFSQSDEGEKTGNMVTGTPTPTLMAEATNIPEPTNTPKPTQAALPTQGQAGPTEVPEPTATPEPTSAMEPTKEPEPTKAPTPAVSVEEATKTVKEKVDTSAYDIQLVNDNLLVGNGSYYQFGAISGQEFLYPFLVVNKMDGSLHFYDSTEDTVFDFTKFPLQTEATPTPEPTSAPGGTLSAEEAYGVLCTYSKEALHIAKEVKEYDAEYGSELTLIDGVDCYRINLSEFSNGKVRNRGEFYVSIDGTKCYYINSDTNEFVEAEK